MLSSIILQMYFNVMLSFLFLKLKLEHSNMGVPENVFKFYYLLCWKIKLEHSNMGVPAKFIAI